MNDLKNSRYPNLQNKKHWNYFEKRIRSAVELKRLIPTSPVEIKELESKLGEPAHKKNRCIYIHVPFCKKSCTFCGYYKCVNPEHETVQKYVEILKTQIIQLSKTAWVKSSSFDALYFGGGTPTALPAPLFFDLLEIINKYLPLATDCEVTLESTITDLNDSFLERLPNSTVNRVSLGIQSFNEEIRKKYNRKANREEIQQKTDEIRKAGITNICADLMYNLAGQTRESWNEDLMWVNKLGFTGCSVYPLLPFPSAPMVKSGDYKAPDPESEYHFFKMADDFFTSLPNWKAITPVQYGHKFLGNAKYVELQSDDADILAIGPGAGGQINGIQYFNGFAVEKFNTIISSPFANSTIFRLSENFQEVQKKMSFFRKSFLSKNEFDTLFENDNDYKEFLLSNRLIIESKTDFKLSQTGKYWAANIAELLIKN